MLATASDVWLAVKGLGAERMSVLFSRPPDPERHVARAPKVMIVEDEAIIAFSLEDVFRDEGYVVLGSFASCAGALQSLETSLPDVAILDATLSDGPCLELALELRRQGLPFLIYSGRHAIKECPPELAGTVWMEKPSSLESVVRAAEKLIGRGARADRPA